MILKNMKMIKILIQILLLATLSLFVSSCVGTVEDSEPPQTNFFDPKDNLFNYPGIIAAYPVAHDKIEIDFYPSYVTNDIEYKLFVNGSDTPVNLNLESLDDAPEGKLKYQLRNLAMNTNYKLKIRAIDPVSGLQSQFENEFVVRTYDNQTAHFFGVNEVKKVVGSTDKSVKVSWVPAQMNGLFAATAYDPVYYEITYITDAGGPNNLNNKNYTGTDRKITRVPDAPTLISPSTNIGEKVINNLTPGATYYFQVRAVNKLYNDYLNDPNYDVTTIPVNRESNARFMSVVMDSSTSLFDFDQTSIVLQNSLGVKAFNEINVFWSPGIGSFDSYRVFIREYDGVDDPQVDDKLDDLMLATMEGLGEYAVIDAEGTSYVKNSLNSYKWYQVKVVLCKTAACPLDPLDPNAGIISEMRAIRTEAILAPFSGITFLDNPTDANALDEINVRFEPPVLSLGYADEMKMFCLDPTDYSKYTQFSPNPGVQINDAPQVGNCNGLALTEDLEITDYNVKLSGLKNTTTTPLAQATYCFAIAPAISSVPPAEVVNLPPANWIVRCISPEIKVPTLEEFPGLNSNCSISGQDATVTWVQPFGGIYNKFQVYWRSVSGAQTFSFDEAIAGNINYSTSGQLADTVTNFTMTGLRPGKKYRVGILAQADDGVNPILYSEYNLGVTTCDIPMPKATFVEWTRIFAIGPKTDGRFPQKDIYQYQDSLGMQAHILEAINADGIPYEVEVDNNGVVIDTNIKQPPGYLISEATTYDEAVDARANADGKNASRYGIISLAWRDVTLDFMQGEFNTEQDHAVPRSNRDYGYRVYRSEDNRITWTEVTDGSGLLHASDYKFKPRPSAADITQRMVFFTDYSVHYSQSINDISRARVYWYKIVPVFEGKELELVDSRFIPHNMIKVTLPPANMALIHRWMANRHGCMELGKSINTGEGKNYSCDYNGLGHSPKITPWQINESILDQGGDLLVDRFELSCNFTRGDYVFDSKAGLSYFSKPASDPMGSKEDVFDFRGYPTDAPDSDDTNNAFKGCYLDPSMGFAGFDDDTTDLDPALYPSYKRVLHGDCLGTHRLSIRSTECPTATSGGGSYSYIFPGASMSGAVPTTYDCNNNINPDEPQVAISTNPDPDFSRLSNQFVRNITVQSEFLGVFYNRGGNNSKGDLYNPPGPTGTMVTGAGGSNSYQQTCFINIASIGETTRMGADTDAWRARWISANMLDNMRDGAGTINNVNRTVAQITADADYYGGSYQAPPTFFWNNQRYDSDTKLSRIFSSNSAKLPPLTGFSQQEAQTICNGYRVQVGIADDSNNWLGTEAPQNKRLMRRQEFITAAAWPTAGDNQQSDDINYTDTFIDSLEKGATGGGSCIDLNRVPARGGIGVNSYLDTNYGYNGNTMTEDAPAFGGSSERDSGEHSEVCTSQWGIQDLVGNVWETTSDIFTCDYSKDQIYFGQYSGDPVSNTGVGIVAQSVPYTPPWSGNTVYIRADAKITFANANPDITSNKAWVRIDPDSGYCSMVDNDSSRPLNASYFRDVSGIFKSVFTSTGVNTSMILTQNTVDQAAVDTLRNGDGFYLNFGQNNIAPQLSNSGTLSLTQNTGVGPYFNPIVGLPLSCGLGSCGTYASDNKLVTIPYYNSLYNPVEPVIRDYPVGNSEISSTGISAYNFNTSAQTFTYTVPATQGPSPATIIEEFVVQGDGSNMANFTTVTKTSNDYVSLYGGGATFPMTVAQWSLPRNSYMSMVSGGGYTGSSAGRFSMANRITSTYYALDDTGFRCVVKINQND